MRKIESLFIGVGLCAVVAVIGGALFVHTTKPAETKTTAFPTTQYGAFLAAQHAIYVNDFENAALFSNQLTKTEYTTVQNTKFLSEFLSGKMPQDAKLLKDEKGPAARIIYDAHLVSQDEWKAFHNRHKTDESALSAPFRIWSAIANDWRTNTFKFISVARFTLKWATLTRQILNSPRFIQIS